ncbi:hypothetical protein [Vibrio phage CKB-S2]|nr:hypothetical protein [Vibrio phage CKB-S2]
MGGGKGGGGGQTTEQKRTELLNQKNLLLQQKQGAAQDKRLAQERYKTEVSEWEAGRLSLARRAAGSARRAGGSVFEKYAEENRPQEGDYSEFDSIMADVDRQISDLDKQIANINKPKPAAPSKPTGSGSDQDRGRDSARDRQNRR